MSEYWYALRSKPRKEEVVYRQVLNHEIEVYYPRIRVNPVNPRARKIQPYFPGYMFVHVDLDVVGLSFFQWMPHTLGLVCWGEEAAIVPEHLIHELKKRVREIAEAGGEFFNGLRKGETVYIRQGPFAGYEALFDTRIPGSERVRVLLKLLNDQRHLPVELNVGYLDRKKK
ncbi:MAG: transcription/translation regulatory transformer protein RfaH [Anaerolineales bacterium]